MTCSANGVGNIIRLQGLGPNCGRYSIEALMRWKHGTKYGRAVTVPAAADARGTQHATYGGRRMISGEAGADGDAEP